MRAVQRSSLPTTSMRSKPCTAPGIPGCSDCPPPRTLRGVSLQTVKMRRQREANLTNTTVQFVDTEGPPRPGPAALKIGPLPIGVYLAAALICALAAYLGQLPND